jgi:Protein of unknown function (DUF4054)
VTLSEFKAQFPDGEFDALDGNYVQKFLDLAVPMFNVVRWGDLYSEGIANFVAHSIVMSKARAARGLQVDAGDVTEQHVGPVGESFNGELQVLFAKDTYMRTDYGQRYCELRDMVGLGGTAGE